MCATRRRPLKGHIELETAAGAHLSDSRIRLLEAIAEHGSLNKAAKAVPLSYKAAWDALDSMNNLSESPLVVRSTGGVNGGGTQLTEHGLRTVALYRAMQGAQQQVLDRLAAARLPEQVQLDPQTMQRVVRRIAMKTSARNAFFGRVDSLRDRGGMVDVRFVLAGGEFVTATVTPESVENLALVPGAEAYALVKAPWVSVTARAPRGAAERNVMAGTVGALQRGDASTRLQVTTDGGLVVTAAMANDEVERQGLREGVRGHAQFATDSVIVLTLG